MLTTSHADVRDDTRSSKLPLTLSRENCNCINNLTRSIGATAVFANDPDNTPAIQSFKAVLDLDVDLSGEGGDEVGVFMIN